MAVLSRTGQMLGVRRSYNFIIFAVLIFSSCGRSPQIEGAPRFLSGQIIERGDGSELSVQRRLTRTWKDYDGDGTPDRLDSDIDNDGIPNLADQYPFDGNRQGEDKDNDEIRDFIDLSFHHNPLVRELATIQEEIFKKIGVTVINGPDNFTYDEWLAMRSTLFHEVMISKIQFKELVTIVRYSQADQLGEARAEFDPYWLQISFYPNSTHLNNVPAFIGSLVHELGHVHAVENPKKFTEFVVNFDQHKIFSPSRYGNSSPEEAYAEVFALECYQAGIEFDESRFDFMQFYPLIKPE